MFSQIISDLRKGCGKPLNNNAECGNAKNKKICYVCQAKLDQTLLCEKIANENTQKIKHFLKLKENIITSICNGDKLTEDNMTNDYFEVTCKVCKEILNKERISIEVNKEKGKHKDFVEKEIEFLESICYSDNRGYISTKKRIKQLKAELESSEGKC